MKRISLSSHLLKEPVKGGLNERQTVIKDFYDTLVKDWDVENYGELKAKRIAIMLAPVKTKDLYAFLADCRYAPHFSKFFWSRFKS